MTLPNAAWSRTFNARPLQIFNAKRRQGNTVRIRKLDLSAIVYETGGFPLNYLNTHLSRIFDATQLLVNDPDGFKIAAATVYPVVTIDGTGAATLKLYNNGAEKTNGWTGAAGEYIWLAFTGVA